jgi:hypothetical protein
MARRRGFGTGRNGARRRRLSRHIETLPSQSASSNPPTRSGRPGADAAPGPGPGRTHDSIRAKRSQTVGDRGGRGVARAVTGAAQSGAQRQSSGQGGALPPELSPLSLWQSVSSPSPACGSLARALLLVAPGCVGLVRLGRARSPFSTRGASPRYWRDFWIAYVGRLLAGVAGSERDLRHVHTVTCPVVVDVCP